MELSAEKPQTGGFPLQACRTRRQAAQGRKVQDSLFSRKHWWMTQPSLPALFLTACGLARRMSRMHVPAHLLHGRQIH